jgi:molybdate transport system regulatory protein
MNTSARNQFHGYVSQLVTGAVNDEVHIAIAPNLEIVATITHGSAQGLGLAVGKEAFALIKASSVIVANVQKEARYSARNSLAGTVERISEGAVNDEIVLDVGNGCSVVAIITRESTQALELQQGTKAIALFKASSVIVGVPG